MVRPRSPNAPMASRMLRPKGTQLGVGRSNRSSRDGLGSGWIDLIEHLHHARCADVEDGALCLGDTLNDGVEDGGIFLAEPAASTAVLKRPCPNSSVVAFAPRATRPASRPPPAAVVAPPATAAPGAAARAPSPGPDGAGRRLRGHGRRGRFGNLQSTDTSLLSQDFISTLVGDQLARRGEPADGT